MTKKVLIAEDQPDSRRLLQDILERFHIFGVETLIARDGTEAWALTQKSKPDLILLDLMMPGLSGFEVCRAVKADPQLMKAYIIVISAKIQRDDRREAARAGADEYLTKPYDINALIERIQAALHVTLP
jgi:CheY-like chemotaxis protein